MSERGSGGGPVTVSPRRVLGLELAGPAGRLEAVLDCGPGAPPRFAALVCHPHPLYGGTLHNKVVHKLAAALRESGGAALRLNFRGAGRSEGRFDHGRGETEDARAALDYLRARFPGAPLWAAGFSFGSWVALRAGAEERQVGKLIAVAPPVSLFDFSFLERSLAPKLIVQGERDEVCSPAQLAAVYPSWSEPKQLAIVHGANHMFDRHLTQLSRVLREYLDEADRA